MAALDPAAATALDGLRRIRLLEGLPEPVLADVAQRCRFRRYRARQAVITRDDHDRDCCLIVAGRVRVVALSTGGRELSFRDAAAGETIGEIAALDGRPRSASVVALQETLLARLPPQDLVELLQQHWPICERLLGHLAAASRAMTERVYELSLLSVQQRLCAELLRRALAVADAGHQDRVLLSPAPSHSELAARISSYREQVTRELAELARLGLVRRTPEGLAVEDLPALAARVEAVRTVA